MRTKLARDFKQKVRTMQKSDNRLLRVALAAAIMIGGLVAVENDARAEDRERSRR